jgi:23S rRNA (pseudouridine1915-N3)-methyltransferase
MKKIEIISFGKTKNSHLQELIYYYQMLCNKYYKFESIIYKDISTKISSKNIKSHGYLIVLSEHGLEFNTLRFANKFNSILQENQIVTFVIGNAWGIDQDLLKKANLVLSLSQFTMAHELAHLIVLEQLYRVLDIKNNGKYHKN